MLESTITRKGQVTIPKAIRDRLGVKEGEKVLFVMRGEEVILKVVKGTILDLRGSVQALEHPEDFEKIRQSVRQAIAKKVVGHG
ncbi:AbrB/MazE/SpoVT family DNA-binding domain-containing protein [Candidatus Nitrospira nitrificans]|uniref:Transcriptional regulator, AbrB family n=1 Tax=Candidatus Nitrospira nitrificans TaxID=1742973 RepID=A0A0S4L4X8_9BACT|nr:AbrB/MazE/SpoVT family DNA-binding domain-containing protein [Candidatus Nitrospira nitrificans]CUS32753.1 Transcriptional regulator, AbrB family [Candidatus Nitrospira nitrificans]